MLQLKAQVQIEAAASADSTPKISVLAYTGEPMRLPGRPRPVVVDMAGLDLSSSVPLLRGHDHDRVLGQGEGALGEDGIHIEGQLSGLGSHVEEVVSLAARGFNWQASIGAEPTREQRVPRGHSAEANGRSYAGPVDIVRAGELREVSIVPVGADQKTNAAIAATGEEVIAEDNQSALEAKLTALEANIGRIAGVVEQSMQNNLLEASRNREELPPSIQADLGCTKGQLVECALDMQTQGFDEDAYDERTLEAASDAFPNGLTLMELVAKTARLNGFKSDSHRISPGMFKAAFRPSIEARGPSTYDLATLLSNIANKQIKQAFMHVDQTWRQVSSIKPVRDLKEVTTLALTGDFLFEELGNGGEIVHGTAGEEKYTNQAKTYAKIFAITEDDLINDDLSAFSRMRRRIARGGALKLNTLFWTEFLADLSTFYTTERGNYFEGSATNLQSTSLQTAQKLLAEQIDPDGQLMGQMGDRLLVPSNLEVPADELYVSTNLNSGGASATEKIPNRNVFAGKYRPIATPYIGAASGITGASDLHWFLCVNPEEDAVIETVFYNNQQVPTVEAAEADFDQLGVRMRGVYRFGVRKQEYRAAVRSKGEA